MPSPLQRKIHDKHPSDRPFRWPSSQERAYINQRKTRASSVDGFDPMARADRSRTRDQGFESQSPGGTGAALPRAFGSDCTHVGETNYLPSSRRSNRALCAGQIPVQLDGFNLEPRSHHHFRVHADDGSRGNGHFQQDIFIESRGSWDFGFHKIDVRYHGPRGDDPISERSGVDEAICGSHSRRAEESWRQVFKSQRPGQRDRLQGQRSGQAIALVCKDQGAKKKSRKEAVPYSPRAAWHDQVRTFQVRAQASWKILDGNRTIVKIDGHFVPADFIFSGNRLCGIEKDYPSADVGTLFHCSRQSRQVRGIWTQVGNQQNRWFCLGIFDQQRDQCFRSEVLSAIHQRTHRSVRAAAKDLRLRPWRPQPCQHQESKKTWREERGDCADWKDELVCVGENVGSDPPRAGPGRGRDWKSEIKKIWLQQTQCEICIGNGDVWPSLVSGLQSVQSTAKTERSTTSNSIAAGASGPVAGDRPGYPQSFT